MLIKIEKLGHWVRMSCLDMMSLEWWGWWSAGHWVCGLGEVDVGSESHLHRNYRVKCSLKEKIGSPHIWWLKISRHVGRKPRLHGIAGTRRGNWTREVSLRRGLAIWPLGSISTVTGDSVCLPVLTRQTALEICIIWLYSFNLLY